MLRSRLPASAIGATVLAAIAFCADPSAQVDALMAPWDGTGTPGAAVLVIRNAQIVHAKGYGMASLANERRITPDTSFLLASVTKQFTAMAIMMLAEQGKLKYDDTLASFFPQFPAYARRITVRHLLNHTAGFPEYDELFQQAGMFRKEDFGLPRKPPGGGFEPTVHDVLQILAKQKEPRFPAGEKFEYSNSGYVLLALIVEKVSGQRFARFLQQRIFGPCGMKRSILSDETRPVVRNAATSYRKENDRWVEVNYSPSNLVYGEDKIYTTIEDLYRWDQALEQHKLVSAATFEEAIKPGKLNDGSATSYGFGWNIGERLGSKAEFHSGAWLGFRTALMRIPERRFTVVVLSNAAVFRPGPLVDQIINIYR
jgi:CubicO group peptidase (beta-lactamase class C family)